MGWPQVGEFGWPPGVLDEFQTFTTLSVATMMAELRKYRVGRVLANQHLSQLDPSIRDAVFGNAGTIISFRVGGADGAFLAREFAPVFSAEDFIGLPFYHIYIRLLIDGESSRPFSATTLAPSQVDVAVSRHVAIGTTA